MNEYEVTVIVKITVRKVRKINVEPIPEPGAFDFGDD